MTRSAASRAQERESKREMAEANWPVRERAEKTGLRAAGEEGGGPRSAELRMAATAASVSPDERWKRTRSARGSGGGTSRGQGARV